MASNYTTNYELPLWATDDAFLRTEFNDANQKIDGALAGKAGKTELAAVEQMVESRVRIATGSYDGTDNTQDIELGFQPAAVLLFTEEGETNYSVTYGGLMTPTLPLKCNNGTQTAAEITASGFRVYGSSVSGCGTSMSTVKYHYLAIY